MTSLLRSKWGIVLGAMIGLIVGTGPIMKVTVSLFMKPITEDLGWSRAGFSAALLFSSLASVVMQPIFGWLIDTYGVKRTTLPLILLLNIAFFALSMMSGSIVLFYFIFLFMGLASCAQAPPMYSKVVSMWFDSKRGLALAIATSGAAIGTMLIPLYAQHVLDLYGWRSAYRALALANLLIAIPVVLFILREPKGYILGKQARNNDAANLPPGMDFRSALRDTRFWLMAGVFLLLGMGLNGPLTHAIAMLTDRGWTTQSAVTLLSVSGLVSIAGRFASGYILDRSNGPGQAALLILLGSVGCMLFATGWNGITPYIALPLLYFCYGADVDIMAYFSSRYFGLRDFGQIYGTAFSAFAMGSAIGPIIMGKAHDSLHSYSSALIVCGVCIFGSYILATRLGTYRFLSQETDTEGENGG